MMITASSFPAQQVVSDEAADSIRQHWAKYADQGLTIFPLKKGGKNPGTDFGIKWQQDWVQAGRATFPDLADTYETGTYGLWLATGQVSKRVVLDIDSPEAERYWREKLGEAVYNRALKVTSGRAKGNFTGHHLHFRIREDDDRAWSGHSCDGSDGDSSRNGTGAYDFRADGGGVVMPPSIHKTGVRYAWLAGELQDAPECLRKENQPKRVRTGDGRSSGSVVTDDLLKAPDDPGRGNNWLSRVGGYFARTERRNYERYIAILRNLNWASTDPIEEGDFNRTAESIWAAEQQQGDRHEQANGWLVGDGERLFTLVEVGQGDEKKLVPAEWSNFDIKVTGIATRADGTRTYDLDMTVDGRTIRDIEFDPTIISQEARLTGWLAARGALVLAAPFDKYMSYPQRVRLAKYLMSQAAPESLIVDHLGWSKQHKQYVTNTGVILAGAAEEARFNGVRPHRDAVRDAKVRYGFEATPAEAVEILREVLTWHDEEATSLIGAWLMMVILRGQYTEHVKPGLQIDAHSGSGKSTLMRMVLQLIGYTRKGGNWTRAALEDALAANLNGVVWLDDKEISEEFQTIIRQASTGGGKQKKRAGEGSEDGGRDYVAATVITSEGMPDTWNTQQANRDRFIRIGLPKVTDRMSLKDPSRQQIEDINELWGVRWGEDFTRVAGSLTAEVLTHIDAVEPIRGGSREEQKYALLRNGARVLARVLDDERHPARVDQWIGKQGSRGNASTVTLEAIPTVWRSLGFPVSAGVDGKCIPVAVYRDGEDGSFWVNAAKLADAFATLPDGKGDRMKALMSQTGISNELRAIGAGPGESKRTGLYGKGAVLKYREIPERYTEEIHRIATGDTE
ncbi:bifunctional DNA primase/polymerase [Streptomyces sp. NBC_00247]|uniref:bifunctional DNA primase/polymerase n=1 Tax=Streptomyces sp. NBC_00247 TaxID=2975689 RepID=UPI002E2A1B9E|nr:bifunctional DNA primase/polymerase [Streptomyces sp. NBC_00247]